MNAWQTDIYRILKDVNGYVKISNISNTSIAFEAKEFRIPEGLKLAKVCADNDLLQWIGLNKNNKVSWVFATKTEA